MSKIFEELRRDHDIQRDLLDHLVATDGDSKSRRKIYQELKNQLEGHARYEERWFYRPLLEDDITMKKVRHSIHEHEQIDEKLEDLENTDFSQTSWLTKAKQLKELVTHHLDEEEQEVFQLAGKALSEKQKNELSSSYKSDMESYRKIESLSH